MKLNNLSNKESRELTSSWLRNCKYSLSSYNLFPPFASHLWARRIPTCAPTRPPSGPKSFLLEAESASSPSSQERKPNQVKACLSDSVGRKEDSAVSSERGRPWGCWQNFQGAGSPSQGVQKIRSQPRTQWPHVHSVGLLQQ